MGLTGRPEAEMGNVKATYLLHGFPSAVKKKRAGLWGMKTAGDEHRCRFLQTHKTTHSQETWEQLLHGCAGGIKEVDGSVERRCSNTVKHMHADGLMEPPTMGTFTQVLKKARLDHGIHSTLKLLFLKQELSNFISLKVTF